jgi:hypothetical protein
LSSVRRWPGGVIGASLPGSVQGGVEVLHDDAEFTVVARAARAAGLRPSGYVATAALTAAQGGSASAQPAVAVSC